MPNNGDRSQYIDDFEREAQEVQEQCEEWQELSWLRRHGPSIACIAAVVGTLLLLGLGMHH